MGKVGIVDLKPHLSLHLRKVRGGRTLTVVDRDTPVAQIIPYDAETLLEVRPGDAETQYLAPTAADLEGHRQPVRPA
jgi:antitoxin (DNA-binding transcriptional repressor) of toxin-antitoxin stability system